MVGDSNPEGRPQLPVKVPSFFVRLLVGIGHNHPNHVAAVVGGGGVACFRGGFIIKVKNVFR